MWFEIRSGDPGAFRQRFRSHMERLDAEEARREFLAQSAPNSAHCESRRNTPVSINAPTLFIWWELIWDAVDLGSAGLVYQQAGLACSGTPQIANIESRLAEMAKASL